MRRAGTIRALALCVAGGAMLAAPAIACPPPPPYPPAPELAAGAPQADVAATELAWGQAWSQTRAEEDRAWALKQQTRLFDAAKSLVIVRYDHEGKTSGYSKDLDYMNGQRLAVLKPVRWVKGAGAGKELQLALQDAEMCQRMPAHDAYYGAPGDVFLIYLKGDKLVQADVLEGFDIKSIAEPRTLAALTKE